MNTTTQETIKRHEYRNGVFGTNTAALMKIEGGYLVHYGFNDPYFFTDHADAELAYDGFVERHPAN